MVPDAPWTGGKPRTGCLPQAGWHPCGQILRGPGRVLQENMPLRFFAILLLPGILYPGQTHIHEYRPSCQHDNIRELDCKEYAGQAFSLDLMLFKLNPHKEAIALTYYIQGNGSLGQRSNISSISRHLAPLELGLNHYDQEIVINYMIQETSLDVTLDKTQTMGCSLQECVICTSKIILSIIVTVFHPGTYLESTRPQCNQWVLAEIWNVTRIFQDIRQRTQNYSCLCGLT